MLSEPNRQMTQTPAWINRAAYRDRHISAIRAPLQDLLLAFRFAPHTHSLGAG